MNEFRSRIPAAKFCRLRLKRKFTEGQTVLSGHRFRQERSKGLRKTSRRTAKKYRKEQRKIAKRRKRTV